MAICRSELPEHNFRAYVVCDGLGGMQNGELCASQAIAHFVTDLFHSRSSSDLMERMRRAAEVSNLEVCRQFREHGGSTLSAILFSASGTMAIAIGDTRIYLHTEHGELVQLTIDDTFAARIAEFADESPTKIGGGPFGNHLAQYVGQGAPLSPQVFDPISQVMSATVESREVRRIGLLIVSDGVHRMGKQTLQEIGRGATSARELVQRIISVSDWLGGTDNATALYVSIPERQQGTLLREAEPIGLQLHDAHSELRIAVVSSMSHRAEVSPRVEQPDRELIDKRAKQSKRREPAKDRRKADRSRGRKRKDQTSDSKQTQPELDIQIDKHQE